MTTKEIKVLEDKLNFWCDAYDSNFVLEYDARSADSAFTHYYTLLDLITALGLKYKEEQVIKKLITTEYITTHYTLYAD